MRKLLCIFVSVLVVVSVSAQNFKSAQIGLVESEGEYKLSIPVSTISIDVVVETEFITPGIYARYSQKFLALKASLTARTNYKIISASLNLVESNNESTSTEPKLAEPRVEYTSLPIDQTSSVVMPAEDAARAAAEAIFTIRRQRQELISGDAGEGYFGGGLASAIASLDAAEAEYTKLFTGERHISQSIRRFTLTPIEGTKQYLVARFDSALGFLAESNLAGAPIYLQTKVLQSLDTTSIEAGYKVADYLWFRVAAPTMCTLYNDSEQIASATLPLYEFGKSIKVEIKNRR